MTRNRTLPESERIFYEAVGLLGRRELLPVATPESVTIGDIVTELQGRWRVIEAKWRGHERPTVAVKMHKTEGQLAGQYGRVWKITEIVLTWYSGKVNSKGVRRSVSIGAGTRHDNAAEDFLRLIAYGPGEPPLGPIWGW